MFGIDNVRGGSYTKLKLEDWQIKSLEHEFILVNDVCFKCKNSGHFADNCNITNELNIYLDSFDTIDKIDCEIKKIIEIYERIIFIKKEIEKTKLCSTETLKIIKEINKNMIKRNKLQKELDNINGDKQSYQDINQKIQNLKKLIQKADSIITKPECNLRLTDAIHNLYVMIFMQKNTNKLIDDYEILTLQLINYKLDKINELNQLFKIYQGEDEIKNKLVKLYEKRIEMIK